MSGIDSSCVLMGRPYGGCAILYRKLLSPFITPLDTCSDRFCAIKLHDSCGLSILMICVYMPSDSSQHASDLYLNTLGEIEGSIGSQEFDVCLIVGDFNVDFSRGGSLKDMLCCFMSGFSLFACDLLYNVDHTYERDDGLVCSLIDHILCTQSFSHLVAEVHTLWSGSNLSDHHPLCFNLLTGCTTVPHSPPPSSNISNSDCILWAKVSASDIENYQNIVGQRLSTFPADILNCGTVDCSFHREFLEEYANQFVSTLTYCAVHCFPIRSSSSPTLVGWKDSCQDLKMKQICGIGFGRKLVVLLQVPFLISGKAPRGNIRHLFVVLNGGRTIWFVRNLLNLFRREGRLASGLRLKS